MKKTTLSNRAGFTLAELLVVIAIISTLLALLVPAVRLAISSARKAAIKTEIDMLHMAVMNYKNEYGGLPPCVGYTNALSERPVRHLRRLFPRCTVPVDQFTSSGVAYLNPTNSLLFWLSGYTGDPERPLTPGPSRKSMYDYDQLRAKSYVYKAPYSLDTPYLFFDSGSYAALDGQTVATDIEPVICKIPKYPGTSNYMEPGRFIILAAGLDGEFYTQDDLSNAWTGTWESFQSQVANQ